jgi:RND superfamily putative drug exporter
MFARLGQLLARHPLRVVLVWVLAAALVVPLAPELKTSSDQSQFLPRSYESIRANALAERAYPERAGSGALVVFKRSDGRPLTAADSRRVAAATRDVARERIPAVGGIATDAGHRRGRHRGRPGRRVQGR